MARKTGTVTAIARNTRGPDAPNLRRRPKNITPAVEKVIAAR